MNISISAKLQSLASRLRTLMRRGGASGKGDAVAPAGAEAMSSLDLDSVTDPLSAHASSVDSAEPGSPGGRRRRAPRALAVIGSWPLGAQYGLALGIVALGLGAMAGLLALAQSLQGRDAQLRAQVSETSLHVQQLRAEMQAASAGSAVSFVAADATLDAWSETLSKLAHYAPALESGSALTLRPAEVTAQGLGARLWQVLATPSIDLAPLLVKGIELRDTAVTVLGRDTVLSSYGAAVEMLRDYEDEADALARIARASTPHLAEQMSDGVRDFGRSLSSYLALPTDLRPADAAIDHLVRMAAIADAMAASPKAAADVRDAARKAAPRLGAEGPAAVRAMTRAHQDFTGAAAAGAAKAAPLAQEYLVMAAQPYMPLGPIAWSRWLALACAAAALGGVWLVLAVGARAAAQADWAAAQVAREAAEQARQAAAAARAEKDATDDAVVKLMRGMQPAANGDLTKMITVSDDVTGSLADRYNLVIQRLGATVAVVKSGTETAGEHINHVEQLTNNLRSITVAAAEAARRSNRDSTEGKESVDQARERANQQREIVQAVAKRAKAMGEAVQSITVVGELVERSIEEARVLAINVSLRASKEGGDTSFFKAIAEYLDQMSNANAAALKRIAANVAQVQSEAQQMIAGIESMSADIVEAHRFWDAAGMALERIHANSVSLGELVVNIDQTSDQQTAAMGQAVKIISELQDRARVFTTPEVA